MHFDHLDRFRSGCCHIAADAELPEYELCMLTGDAVVIDDEHVHLVRAERRIIFIRRTAAGTPKRDSDYEGRAYSLFALDIDMAVHKLNDALGDRHAETCAAVFISAG